MYVDEVLDDGTVYNFYLYDPHSGLTYYMYFPTKTFTKSQRGKIVQVRDDYGNKIQYNYPSGTNYYSPVQIIDTYGREINVSSSGITYVDDDGKEQKIVYERSNLSADSLDNNSLLKHKPVNRLTVTNQEGEQTHYDSRPVNTFTLYTSSNTLTVGRPATVPISPLDTSTGHNLERIVYPTGMEKHYNYVDIYVRYSQGMVMRSMYAVSSSYEKDGENVINKNNYTLSGNTTRIIEAVRDADGRKITKTFDLKGRLLTNHLTSSSTANILSGSSYTYDEDDNVSKEIVYNNTVPSTYNYTYKRRGLLRTVSDDYGKIYYTYYGNSRLYDTVSYYNGSSLSYSEKNTFVDGHLKIASSYTVKGENEFAKSTYEYDEEGNLITEKIWTSDSDGNYELDENDVYTVLNRSTVIGDNMTPVVTDTAAEIYDVDGNIMDGTSVEYGFNVYGSPVRQTDAYGNITSIAYDGLNRPIKYAYPNSVTRTVDYSAEDKRIIVTDENGVQYKYTYNTLGYESGKYILHNGEWKPVYTKEYDTVGGRLSRVVQYTAENTGIVREYTYDFADRPLTETVKAFEGDEEPSELYTTTYTYTHNTGNSNRSEIAVTVRDGFTTTVTKKYGRYNRLLSETITDGTETLVTSYDYDYKGRPVTVTDANGGTTETVYTIFGNVSSVTDPAGNIIDYAYDCAGRQISITDAKGNTTRMYYDGLDRLIKTETPVTSNACGVAKAYYDKNSRLIKEAVNRSLPFGAEKFACTEYVYDCMNNLTGVLSENDNEDSAVVYTYTPAGKISGMVTGLRSFEQNTDDGAKTSYEYNSYGQLEKVTDALGQSVTYTYDYFGNQLTSTDRNGTFTANSYGVFGVESSVSQNGNNTQSVVNSYDSAGNVTGIASYTNGNIDSSIEYSFDAFGRMLSEFDGEYLKSYTYDVFSNLTGYQLLKDGEIKDSLTYSYDELSRLTEIDNGDTITAYTYDCNNNVVSKTNGSFTTEYTYNAGNLVTELTNKYDGSIVSGYTYKYSLDGNRVSEASSDGTAKYYTYDALGRLESEVQRDTDGQSIYNSSYSYDRSGNRKTLTVNGETTTYEYDLNNRLTAAVTDTGGAWYNYDSNGNQILSRSIESADENDASISGISGNNYDYTINEYDLYNRLINVNDSGKEFYSYTYHADGLRKSKTVNGATTTYSWNNGNMVAETTSDGTAIYEYDLQGVSRRIKDGSSS